MQRGVPASACKRGGQTQLARASSPPLSFLLSSVAGSLLFALSRLA